MKFKIFCLVVLTCSILIFTKKILYANGLQNNDLEFSAINFINLYYRDIMEGNKVKIRQYFAESPDEESLKLLTDSGRFVNYKTLDNEDLEYMVVSGKLLKDILEKIDFIQTTILFNKPLIIEVDLIEVYHPPHVSDETRFILKGLGGYSWKIIDITSPRLP